MKENIATYRLGQNPLASYIDELTDEECRTYAQELLYHIPDATGYLLQDLTDELAELRALRPLAFAPKEVAERVTRYFGDRKVVSLYYFWKGDWERGDAWEEVKRVKPHDQLAQKCHSAEYWIWATVLPSPKNHLQQ